MNKATSSSREIGLVGSFVWFIFEFMLGCLIGWLIIVIISFTLLFSRGYQSALNYTIYLLQGQLTYLNNMPHTLLLQTPLTFVVKCSHQIYQWLFIKTNLLKTMPNMSFKEKGYLDFSSHLLFVNYSIISESKQLFFTATVLIVVRWLIIFMSLPLFILMAVLGFIDGLMKRELRRYQGGRESALVYHRAKSCIKPVFLVGCILYLTLPLNLPPDIVLLPFAMAIGYLIALTTKMFKKYV